MCPSEHTDWMRASFTLNLFKVWKELNLHLAKDVYRLDDCYPLDNDWTLISDSH